jgi:hypothetical protein
MISLTLFLILTSVLRTISVERSGYRKEVRVTGPPDINLEEAMYNILLVNIEITNN